MQMFSDSVLLTVPNEEIFLEIIFLKLEMADATSNCLWPDM